MRVVTGGASRRAAERRHEPVLLDEVVEHLAVGPGVQCVDCTLGLGGHAAALLRTGATVLGIDRDPQARSLASGRLASFGDRFSLFSRPAGFAAASAELVDSGEHFDAVLADLGVSSLQLDLAERGFGMRSDAPLDMRMGADSPQTALELIDRLEVEELAGIIWRYGEERASRRVARALKRARQHGARSGRELADAVAAAVPGRHPRHPAQRTFQALRIATNDELGELKCLLRLLPELLRPGGRAAIISFHSLEDRLVKQAFRYHHADGRLAAISRKVVTPGPAELARNRRAASAKLRWAVR